MSELKPFDEFMDALVHCDTVKVILTGCGESTFETKPIHEGICALANRRAQPAEPLTLERLREMDGEPVWCADGEGHSCYCLVNAESEDCIDSECGAWCFGFYGMTGDGENGLHNMGWLAYAHKPGGEQE